MDSEPFDILLLAIAKILTPRVGRHLTACKCSTFLLEMLSMIYNSKRKQNIHM